MSATMALPSALFVDDEEQVLGGIAESMRRKPFRVLTASDPKVALSILDREAVSVVVSDEHMPGMRGTVFLQEVRRRHPHVVRLVLSGTADPKAISEAVNQAGVFRYLLKPCPPGDLALAVEQALEAHAVHVVSAPQHGIGLHLDDAIAGMHMAMQPMYHCRTGALYAHEALLRVSGSLPVSATDLIDASHRSGRLWEVERGIRAHVAARIGSRPPGSLMFVNLHPNSLLDPQLYSQHDALASQSEVVVIEITERGPLTEIPDLTRRIAALRDMGYRIAVDDMGSGYSGFNAFAIEPDFVKFDRALIQGAHRAEAEHRLVQSIATLCQDLGIATVAEGIEEQRDFEIVRAIGCDFAQGFLLARPSERFRPGPFRQP